MEVGVGKLGPVSCCEVVEGGLSETLWKVVTPDVLWSDSECPG